MEVTISTLKENLEELLKIQGIVTSITLFLFVFFPKFDIVMEFMVNNIVNDLRID